MILSVHKLPIIVKSLCADEIKIILQYFSVMKTCQVTVSVFPLQISSLVGHEDAVQCLIFDRAGEYMVSGGSDCTIRIWS